MKTPQINEAMTEAFERAREAQIEFWNALGDLERVIGVLEVDSTQDLCDVELSDLLKAER